RMGAGPEHLLASGLEAKLRAEGHSVVVETIEPDPASWAAEIHTAFELARILAKRVKAARNANRKNRNSGSPTGRHKLLLTLSGKQK
ncbi:MAG: hypothetical protein QOJ64_2540, partial [Acidobacteriota bacterium]|nr:hypothetical protein [Acidobacteriota bacterium]